MITTPTVSGKPGQAPRVDAGRPIAHVAADAGVSRQCLSKWHGRWTAEGEQGLVDRSSRPSASPRRTSAELTARIEQLRRTRKFGPARIAHHLAMTGIQIAASTVHPCSDSGCPGCATWTGPAAASPRHRHRRAGPPEQLRVLRARQPGRFGAHVKKLGKIRDGGGWWAHGRGSAQHLASRNAPRVGYDYLHVCIDDHTRLAYAEVLPDETGLTWADFITRAATFMAAYGITITAVMSDNASPTDTQPPAPRPSPL